ncbi:MAG: ATP12 family protein [Parvularculaceae bacterium]
MSAGGIKRPYEKAHVAAEDGRHAILLDGRNAKTRAGATLSAPTAGLAEAVADEWDAQGPRIDHASMPLTRLLMTAIDLGPDDAAEWRQSILTFLKSDVLCYRADEPAALVTAQSESWDPLLDWAREVIGANLQTTAGVGFVEQPIEALKAVENTLTDASHEELIAVRTAAEISGSAIIALALWRDARGADALFDLARLDEAFQENRWGVDAEAAARTDAMRRDFNNAALFLRLVR